MRGSQRPWMTLLERRDRTDPAASQRIAHLVRAGTTTLVLLLAWLGPARAEQVVQEASGKGHQHLQPFTVRDGWELRWEAIGNDTILQIVVDKLGGAGRDMPIDTVTVEAPATGKKFFEKGGTYYIRVIGIGGAWKVTVVQVPLASN